MEIPIDILYKLKKAKKTPPPIQPKEDREAKKRADQMLKSRGKVLYPDGIKHGNGEEATSIWSN